MMSCKETARLLSEGCDRPLSWPDKIKVRLHLAMCFVCRNFAKQIDMIRKLARTAGESDAGSLVVDGRVLDQSLPPETKLRIKKMLSSGR